MKCHLCHSENKHRFAEVESFGYPLVYNICDNCGLVYQSPDTNRSTDPDFYAETYRKVYQGNPNPTEKDLWVQRQRANHLVDLVSSQCEVPPQNFLDIGASTGTLMLKFQQAFGCDVMGVEPGSAYRAFAEANGLRMVASIENLIDTKPARFDLISLVHVLEHLPDPVATLFKIKEELLSVDGRLLLEVPNLYGHDSFELAHVTCFSCHTLSETLRQAGFAIQFLTRHGYPRSEMLKLYITLLAKPLPEAVPVLPGRKERFVYLKRQFGLGYRRLIQKLFPKKAWLPFPGKAGS
jgi:SAM-dependent methyltransferase